MTDVTNADALRDAFSFRLFSTSNTPVHILPVSSTYLTTHYPHYTMPPRSGPLCDLPLERFTDLRFIPTTPRRAHKRPLSPGTPNLFSPTKRRILAQEGVFSPEKTIKSSIAPSYRALVTRDFLSQSPARKLDFGRSPQSDNKVASTSCLLEDCFMELAPGCAPPMPRHDRHNSSLPIPNASSSSLSSISSSSPNPQTNTHYPGFDIWVDSDSAFSSMPSHFSLGDPYVSDEDKENAHDSKENVRPKTKLRTGLSKRLRLVSVASPEQQVRRPNTPKIPFTPLNARSPLEARLPPELTPGKAMNVDKHEMRRRRELLAMELDGEDSDDDL